MSLEVAERAVREGDLAAALTSLQGEVRKDASNPALRISPLVAELTMLPIPTSAKAGPRAPAKLLANPLAARAPIRLRGPNTPPCLASSPAMTCP